MTAILLFRLQDDRIRVLEETVEVFEETVESWKKDHEDAMLALEADDIVAECAVFWEDTRRLWARTRRQATRNRFSDLQEAGKTFLDLLSRSIRLLESTAKMAEKVSNATGHTIEGRENLPDAIREATDLREHVLEVWPWDERPILPLNRKMAEESRSSRDRGESMDVADVIAGLLQDKSPG